VSYISGGLDLIPLNLKESHSQWQTKAQQNGKKKEKIKETNGRQNIITH
jgi:hypothetical protein